MDDHKCTHEQDWGKQDELNAMVRRHISEIPAREARLVNIENAIKSVRGWAIIAAFVGGLLGRAAPDALSYIVKNVYAQEKAVSNASEDASPTDML